MKYRLIIPAILAIFLLVGCQDDKAKIESRYSPDRVEIEQEELKATITTEDELGKFLGSKTKPASATLRRGEEEVVEVVKEPEILDALDYPVAFVSQAPYAVWDDLHKEACEEAAIITIVKYFKNESLTPHSMEQAILSLVEWEEENDYKIDLTAAEAVEILQNYFEFNAELVTEVTVERIKQELSAGKLIIVPAAGRQLGNPYFQTPGPIYHMLVIRGYTSTEFITNDVGTKRGDGFKYKYQQLIDAIHDWDHNLAKDGMTDEEIEQGRKVMIVVDK